MENGIEIPIFFFDGDKMTELESRCVDTNKTHGTSSTHSAAIAALGLLAVASTPQGHGPVHHFHALWK